LKRARRLAWVALAVLAASAEARADDIEDFQHARNAYDAQNFPLAAKRFEALVGGDAPRLRSRPLVLESRKYLAASYLFVGRRRDAERQLERLLREDETYQIDPLSFPTEVLDLFTSVRNRLYKERKSSQTARAEAERSQRQRADSYKRRKRIAYQRLVTLAQTERVREVSSRWVASIPFGAGQFQNGDEGLGLALAVTEGLLFATSVTTFFLHESLRDVQPSADRRDNAELAENTYRTINWASTGLFVAVALGGIIDAHLRFRPLKETYHRRPLPKGWTRDIGLELGGSHVTLKTRF
jgi:hypothetical protein